MGVTNEWKGAIKSNLILKTTGSGWTQPGYDFKQQDLPFVMQIHRAAVMLFCTPKAEGHPLWSRLITLAF